MAAISGNIAKSQESPEHNGTTLMLSHEIVQKRSGSNTILDQLLAAIQVAHKHG